MQPRKISEVSRLGDPNPTHNTSLKKYAPSTEYERRRRRKHGLSNNRVARRFGISPALHCRACNCRLSDYCLDDMCEFCLRHAKSQRHQLDFDAIPETRPVSLLPILWNDPSEIEFIAGVIVEEGSITPDIDYALDISDNVAWDLEDVV